MKKVLLVIGIIILVIIVGIVIFLNVLSKRPAAPDDYQNSVSTGGEIEAKYMANGTYEVLSKEVPVLQGFSKFTIYYPSRLLSDNKAYPVIVTTNGSSTPISKYPAVVKHFASWGFIVIGTEEEFDWNGFSSEMCLRYLEVFNELEIIDEEKNIFYQKIDLDNVGIVGHSQGGVGVFNAITTQDHSHLFKAAVAISPTNKELSHNIFWDYDATLINIPTLVMSGAGGGDDWVATIDQLKEIYNDIPSNKVMFRRSNTAHGEMLYSANGYVTAWFMWLLQDDQEAAKAFIGNNPEILNNNLYEDQEISLDF